MMHCTGSPWGDVGACDDSQSFEYFSNQGLDALLAQWGFADRVSPQAHAVLLGMLAVNHDARFSLAQVREAVNAWLAVDLPEPVLPRAVRAAGARQTAKPFDMEQHEHSEFSVETVATESVDATAAHHIAVGGLRVDAAANGFEDDYFSDDEDSYAALDDSVGLRSQFGYYTATEYHSDEDELM